MTRPRARARGFRGNDKGQAAVELALVTPVIATLLLCVVQVGLVVYHQLELTHASREAARQVAVEPGVDAARRAALSGSTLRSDALTVDIGPRGEPGSLVTVTLRYRDATDLPLVGALIPDLDLTASTTMRVET